MTPSSSSSLALSQMEPVAVGLQHLVIEFEMKSHILRGLGSSLKAAFCGVRQAFSSNSSGFLIKVMGTSRWMHIMKRGPAAFSPLTSSSGYPSMVCRSETTSSWLGGWLVLLSLLSSLERTSVSGSERFKVARKVFDKFGHVDGAAVLLQEGHVFSQSMRQL